MPRSVQLVLGVNVTPGSIVKVETYIAGNIANITTSILEVSATYHRGRWQEKQKFYRTKELPCRVLKSTGKNPLVENSFVYVLCVPDEIKPKDIKVPCLMFEAHRSGNAEGVWMAVPGRPQMLVKSIVHVAKPDRELYLGQKIMSELSPLDHIEFTITKSKMPSVSESKDLAEQISESEKRGKGSQDEILLGSLSEPVRLDTQLKVVTFSDLQHPELTSTHYLVVRAFGRSYSIVGGIHYPTVFARCCILRSEGHDKLAVTEPNCSADSNMQAGFTCINTKLAQAHGFDYPCVLQLLSFDASKKVWTFLERRSDRSGPLTMRVKSISVSTQQEYIAVTVAKTKHGTEAPPIAGAPTVTGDMVVLYHGKNGGFTTTLERTVLIDGFKNSTRSNMSGVDFCSIPQLGVWLINGDAKEIMKGKVVIQTLVPVGNDPKLVKFQSETRDNSERAKAAGIILRLGKIDHKVSRELLKNCIREYESGITEKGKKLGTFLYFPFVGAYLDLESVGRILATKDYAYVFVEITYKTGPLGNLYTMSSK